MEIIRLLRKFSPQMVNHIVAMIVFSGALNSAILAIICAVAISPEKNMLLMFPGELWHRVMPNKSKQSRMSMSFNMYVQN